MTLLIAVSITVAAWLAFVFALWFRKQRVFRDTPLLGQSGIVYTSLNPEGSVIVSGEIWRARAAHRDFVEADARVRVTGTNEIYLLVESF